MQMVSNHHIRNSRGTCRPGAICNRVEGLTPKVMNHCLARLMEYSILEKQSFPEIPPRVEYALTTFGLSFMGIFDMLEQLSLELGNQTDINA